MSKIVKNIGAQRILVADRVEDVFANWTDLGITRGDITVTIDEGTIATGRADQSGTTPLANAVWKTGSGVTVQVPLVDIQIAKLLLVAENSVKVEDSSLEALGFGTEQGFVTERAFCLIPNHIYQKDNVADIWKSPFVHWIRNAYVNITGQITHNLPEGDDVLSGRVLECEITQLDSDELMQGGIGSVFILNNPMSVMGVNSTAQFSNAVTDSTLRSALSATTVQELANQSTAIDVSTETTIADLTGIEFAGKVTDFNFAGNAITVLPDLSGFTQLTNFDISDNDLSEEVASEFINQMWKIRDEIGANSATIDVSSNNGLSQKATDQINGTGIYNGDGLTDAGATVTV